MSAARRVFVTGATGFIGTKLVHALVQRGWMVHALSRSTSNTQGLENDLVKLVRGDLLDPASLREGMEGCEHVYHLAAYAKNWARHKTTFFEQNVAGTRHVLSAAQAAGVARVLCTSSVVTLGPTAPGMVGDETGSRRDGRCFTEYEESKVEVEREVRQCMEPGVPVVVVNPTRVFGPGKLTEGNSVTLMIDQYVRGRLPFLLNGGVNVGNYVLVDDLVHGYLLAMEKGRPGERYILGGENVSLRRFFELVDEAMGHKHRQITLPPWAALAFAGLEKLKAQCLGIYPRITPGWVRTFLQDWAYSSAKAGRELGYSSTPLREGLRLTCEWLQRRGADQSLGDARTCPE
jgi:nucleoside-diphosphate-sugar epimerase